MTEADNNPSHEIENDIHLLLRLLKIYATEITQIIEIFCLRSTQCLYPAGKQ